MPGRGGRGHLMGLEVPLPDDQAIRGLYVDEAEDRVHVGLVDQGGRRVTSLTVTPARWPRIGTARCPVRDGVFTVTGCWAEGEPVVVEIHPCRPAPDEESWLAEGAWQIAVNAITAEGAEMQALAHMQSERPDQQPGRPEVRHLRPTHQQLPPAFAAER